MFKYLFINTNNPSQKGSKTVLNFSCESVRKRSTSNKAGKRIFLLQIILHAFPAAYKIPHLSQFFCHLTRWKGTHHIFMILSAFHCPNI
ncbi:hypothetical protein EVA_13453 [gut metagenome]|uniref:Uncharacterized protein n=1 Tax=gut metagenome TaxID=749906 RepID=J9G9I5_9ZZZZ